MPGPLPGPGPVPVPGPVPGSVYTSSFNSQNAFGLLTIILSNLYLCSGKEVHQFLMIYLG